jgi:chloramphenicol-sensitive protein RarD
MLLICFRVAVHRGFSHTACMASSENRDTRNGFLFAGGAYLIWGFLPLYMKLMSHIPALEILVHRVWWAMPVAAVILWWQGALGKVGQAIKTPRMLAMAALLAVIISINWGTYVWAVTSGRALETALGYYINPLFSVFLAAVLIGEKLKPVQWCAIGLAAVAVGVLTVDAGGLPWVSLVLTISWGIYAYFKRTLPIGASEGFFLEVLVLALPCLGYWIWLQSTGQSHFGGVNIMDTLLLLCAGFVTAIPLMLYAHGAKGLRLTTIALMQYSAPTMIFLIAVFVFKEPFSTMKLIAFLLIWTALAIYTWSLVKARAGAMA